MAARHPSPSRLRRTSNSTDPDTNTNSSTSLCAFLSRFRLNKSRQSIGLLAFAILGGGMASLAMLVAIVFLGPLVILWSPVWLPLVLATFVVVIGSIVVCSLCGAFVVGGSWVYRYSTGRQPVGAEQVDYARNRLAETASHMKECAREYGEYLHNRVKDVAPGA